MLTRKRRTSRSGTVDGVPDLVEPRFLVFVLGIALVTFLLARPTGPFVRGISYLFVLLCMAGVAAARVSMGRRAGIVSVVRGWIGTRDAHGIAFFAVLLAQAPTWAAFGHLDIAATFVAIGLPPILASSWRPLARAVRQVVSR